MLRTPLKRRQPGSRSRSRNADPGPLADFVLEETVDRLDGQPVRRRNRGRRVAGALERARHDRGEAHIAQALGKPLGLRASGGIQVNAGRTAHHHPADRIGHSMPDQQKRRRRRVHFPPASTPPIPVAAKCARCAIVSGARAELFIASPSVPPRDT